MAEDELASTEQCHQIFTLRWSMLWTMRRESLSGWVYGTHNHRAQWGIDACQWGPSGFHYFYSNRGLLPREHLTKDPVHKTKWSGTALVVLVKAKHYEVNILHSSPTVLPCQLHQESSFHVCMMCFWALPSVPFSYLPTTTLTTEASWQIMLSGMAYSSASGGSWPLVMLRKCKN